jgi:hypothetical protein
MALSYLVFDFGTFHLGSNAVLWERKGIYQIGTHMVSGMGGCTLLVDATHLKGVWQASSVSYGRFLYVQGVEGPWLLEYLSSTRLSVITQVATCQDIQYWFLRK